MKRKRTTKTDEGDPMLEQIRRAWTQLDREPGGPLGWLVNTFTREESAGWLPGEPEAHGHRLLALVYGRQSANRHWLRDVGVAIPPMSTEDVVQLHGALGAFLRQLVTVPEGRLVRVPTEGLEVGIARLTGPGEKPALFVKTSGGPRRTILFQAVVDLIAQTETIARSRLVACKQCGAPMLALRKAVFCVPACLQKWHDARRDKKTGQRPTRGGR